MSLKSEIIKEGMQFVKQNKSFKIDTKFKDSFNYISPRISSEFMDCSMPMTFDQYSHCSLGCLYCFAYLFKTQNPSFSTKLHSVNPKEVIKGITGKATGGRYYQLYEEFFKKRFLLHWGGLADPFCNFEKVNDVGYKIIKVLAKENYPTLFSFKGSAIFQKKFVELFDKYADQQNFAFQVSIIAPTDEISRQIEIGTPVTSKRIRAIKMLSDMGYYTILRLRPFIIGITDVGLDDLLGQCLEAGIDAISMEFFAMDLRMNKALKKRNKWIGHLIGVDNIVKYFKTLSPSERGGYLRLNRLVKERFVKKVYTFCVDNKILFTCSDPDYKELSMSGNCCGMPQKFKKNEEMENWTHNQLSFHIVRARRQYNRKGLIASLKFDRVFNPNMDTYLVNREMVFDHVSIVNKSAGERSSITFLDIAKTCWNNLASPGNPRNYFHEKIMPIDVDNNGNYIFKYVPSEYEDRWKKEGIDLTL